MSAQTKSMKKASVDPRAAIRSRSRSPSATNNLTSQLRAARNLQRNASSNHHKLFSIKNKIVIKGPNHSYRDFRVSATSLRASSNQRKAKEFVAPEKLVDMHPKERVVYDFN